MDGSFLIELLGIAFVSGNFVSAIRANQRSLVRTQADQTVRFDKLEVKVDRIGDRLDSLPCRRCDERV